MKRFALILALPVFIGCICIFENSNAAAWEPTLGPGCVSGGGGMCIDSGASAVYTNSFWCEKLDIKGGCYY